MNINRANKQKKACWKNVSKLVCKLERETGPDGKHTHSLQEIMMASLGYAGGWIAGVAWVKRQNKVKGTK